MKDNHLLGEALQSKLWRAGVGAGFCSDFLSVIVKDSFNDSKQFYYWLLELSSQKPALTPAHHGLLLF